MIQLDPLNLTFNFLYLVSLLVGYPVAASLVAYLIYKDP